MAASKYNIDMCRGPLFPKIIRFAVPLYFTTVLQLLFHMAEATENTVESAPAAERVLPSGLAVVRR